MPVVDFRVSLPSFWWSILHQLHQLAALPPKTTAPCLTKLPLIDRVASFFLFFTQTASLMNACIQGALFYHVRCMQSSIFST